MSMKVGETITRFTHTGIVLKEFIIARLPYYKIWLAEVEEEDEGERHGERKREEKTESERWRESDIKSKQTYLRERRGGG